MRKLIIAFCIVLVILMIASLLIGLVLHDVFYIALAIFIAVICDIKINISM